MHCLGILRSHADTVEWISRWSMWSTHENLVDEEGKGLDMVWSANVIVVIQTTLLRRRNHGNILALHTAKSIT